jgi:flagellar biosynthesis protein FlhB
LSGKKERTEEPTAKRKREARLDGQLARSPELVAWSQLLAASLLIRLSVTLGAHSLVGLMDKMENAMARPEPASALRLLGTGAKGAALALAPLAVGMFVLGIVGNLAQIGLAFSPRALKPKWDRLSPAKGIKRMVSPHSIWEAGKALLKLAVLGLVAWPTISHVTTTLATGGRLPAAEVMALVGASTLRLVRDTALAGLVLAFIDYALQRRRVKKATMMTRQEVREESRQSEGDPQTRARIRQRQTEISRNRMMSSVAKATVVVVNPTHVAVALRYLPEAGAPRVVAKGKGHIAARIREEAKRHNVPIVRDVPLARTLHSVCRLDKEIPADLYEAVARLLAFVFSLRQRVA